MPEEIPRWPLILFGDGYFSQVREKFIELNEERYRLDKNLNQEGLIRIWFPLSVVHILREDPTHGLYLVETSFDFQDTLLSLRDATYTEMMMMQDQIIQTQKAQISKLLNDRELQTARDEEWFEKQRKMFGYKKSPVTDEYLLDQPKEHGKG